MENTRPPSREPEGEPDTEAANPASISIDALDTGGVLDVIHQVDRAAWEALDRAARAGLGEIVDRVVDRFHRGGRLIYVGAGTSGRLGVLDASECPPTFGVPPDRVVGIIAGGDRALRESIEGAEDRPEDGARDVRAVGLRASDLVCGIASSATTPYVLGALEEARRTGAATALLCCNEVSAVRRSALAIDTIVELRVGPEVIAGSTRMKAGTATKMALNMISTAAMIRTGKVYRNLMVDVQPVNTKLRRRAARLVEGLGGVGRDRALELLDLADGNVKAAVVMARRGVAGDAARKLLEQHGGFLGPVIDD